MVSPGMIWQLSTSFTPGRLGLGDRVTFRYGNALDMPFDNGIFDVVWTQNTLMNIENKRRLFKEVYRVPRRGRAEARESMGQDKAGRLRMVGGSLGPEF